MLWEGGREGSADDSTKSHSFCSGKEEAQAPGAGGGGEARPWALERVTDPFLCACRPARPHSWRAACLGLGVRTSAWASLSFRVTDSLRSRKPLTQPSPPGVLSLGGKNLAKPPGEISSDANDEIFHCFSFSLCVPPSSGILLFFFFWLVPISCSWKPGGPLAIPVLTEN